MDKQHHIIGRAVLELNTGQLADVWSLQEDVSRIFQQQALPEMERLFDRLVGEEEVVRLERVVVEIDPVDSRFLADEFVDQLLDALNQTLSDRLAGRIPLNTDTETLTQDRAGADWEVLLYFLEYGRLPWWCLAEDWSNWLPRWQAVMQSESQWRSPLRKLLSTNSVVRQRLVMQLPEAFRYQLVLQLQPTWTNWSNLLKQARKLMQSLKLSASLFKYLEEKAWELLLAEIGSDTNLGRPLPVATWMRNWLARLLVTLPVVFDPADRIETGTKSTSTDGKEETFKETQQQQKRLLNRQENTQQILGQHLREFLEATSIAERPLWLAALEQVLPLTSSDTIAPSTNLRSTSTFPAYDVNSSSDQLQDSESRPPSLGEIRSQSPPELISDPAEFVIRLSSNGDKGTGEEGDLEGNNLRDEIPETSDRPTLPTSESPPNVNPNLPSVEQSSQNSIESLDILSMMNLPPRKEGSSLLSSAEEEAGLYVTQAGLVLLHPFLHIYFDAVGLLEGESFQDELAQQTAIYLLYYLATKQTDAPEYELILPKLLCGWPLNEPVARGLDFPESALAEGEHLLQNAIDHWQALKSTSPDGLRDVFLQRDGKLTRTDSGWKLRVEHKAIDILLSRLPWGLSMVRLPWMNELLTVEWT